MPAHALAKLKEEFVKNKEWMPVDNRIYVTDAFIQIEKNRKHKAKQAKGKCPPGQVRNSGTKQCREKLKPGPKPKDPNPTNVRKKHSLRK